MDRALLALHLGHRSRSKYSQARFSNSGGSRSRCTPLATSGSNLGGLPSWHHDAEYPPCPGCRRYMPFVGQLDCGQLDCAEGLIYPFFCEECRTGATSYQQT